MTNRGLVGSVLINLILVHLTSGQASAGPRCAYKPEEKAASNNLFLNTTWQMCLNFACLDSGVYNDEPNFAKINNGTGIRSIGAYNYLEHQRAQGSFHLGILEAPEFELDFQSNGPVLNYSGAYEIETYPLIYKGAPLFGWFHLRLRQLGSRTWYTSDKRSYNRDIQWFVTQAQMNSSFSLLKRSHILGEFVHGTFQGDCTTKGFGYGTGIKLSRQNLQPCLSAQNPSPVMSQAFAWNTEAESPPNQGLREARFNWRLNFPLCPVFYGGNEVEPDNAIIFRTFVQGKMSLPEVENYPANAYRGRFALTAEIILKDYVSGGHDPAPPPFESPSCSKNCSQNQPPWVNYCSGQKTLMYGSNANNNRYIIQNSCTKIIDKDHEITGLRRRFYGRCNLPADKNIPGSTPDPNMGYQCRFTSPFYEGLETHSAYVAKVKEYQQRFCMNCPPVTATEPSMVVITVNITLELNKIYQAQIICHGICMTMATMLTVPLGNYIARYLKESFMGSRILQTHVWYQLHAHLYCVSLVLLIVGWILAWNFGGSGTDMFVNLHVGFGRFSIIMFVFLFLISGIRTYRWRLLNCSVALHTVGGYVCFVLFLTEYLLTLAMNKSSLVPPTSLFSPAIFANSIKTAWVVLGTFGVWVLFTLVCNFESSFLIRRIDKSAAVEGTRKWVLSFIPLPTIPFDKEDDLDGTGKRVVRCGVFLVVSLIATLFTIATMSKHYFETLLLRDGTYPVTTVSTNNVSALLNGR